MQSAPATTSSAGARAAIPAFIFVWATGYVVAKLAAKITAKVIAQRDPQPARQHAKSFHVITVLVRDENRVEFVQALSQLGGPQLELFHTETAIDKHPGARRHDQNGVAAAAASQ